MPVDTPHPDHEKNMPEWQKMRDVLAGEKAVKYQGPLYLPKLDDQSETDYQAYKQRAKFFNATGKTLLSFKGFIFRKDPEIKAPASMDAWMENATLTGVEWYDYAKDVTEEVIGLGRCGTLVDWEPVVNAPYLRRYSAENILNWKTELIAGKQVLTLLVLSEQDSRFIPLDPGEKPPDEYDHKLYDQWRVYRLQLDGAGERFAICEVYRKKDNKDKKESFVMIEQAVPTRRGQPLDMIPFIFHGPQNSLPDVDQIPLLDLGNANLSHYRTSADLQNGRHYTGLPVPYAIGFDAKEKLHVGATVAWVTENNGAKCGYLEFTGQGLKALVDDLEESERYMAALGAKMLEPQAKKAEAYDTVAIRAASETSALASIAVAIGCSLTEVMELVGWWIGTDDSPDSLEDLVSITLSTDFIAGTIPADLLAALTGAYQARTLDLETYFWNLKRCEMIDPDRSFDQFRESIQNDPVMSLPALPPSNTPPPAN